jgi:hypothetical protein
LTEHVEAHGDEGGWRTGRDGAGQTGSRDNGGQEESPATCLFLVWRPWLGEESLDSISPPIYSFFFLCSPYFLFFCCPRRCLISMAWSTPPVSETTHIHIRRSHKHRARATLTQPNAQSSASSCPRQAPPWSGSSSKEASTPCFLPICALTSSEQAFGR